MTKQRRERPKSFSVLLNYARVSALLFICCENHGHAQMTSMGPGKTPDTGKSKYTYPQPPKSVPVPPSAMHPGVQIPEHPERYIWKLTGKPYGLVNAQESDDVSVYSFPYSGKMSLVGTAKTGEEITLDEVRPVGRTLFYKFDWKGSGEKEKFGPAPEFWVNGANIEYAGTR